MAGIDYARIAAVYDDLPVRHAIDPEPALARARRVLDVGCGTGLWLAAQSAAHPGVTFCGVDPSPEMLARARARLPGVALHVATAEELPFDNGYFDFVSMRFCHHHFDDLPWALDEAARVLAPRGRFVMMNIDPHAMAGHWIFRWFPAAPAMNARYLDPGRLRDLLAERGFAVSIERRHLAGEITLAEALRQARRRDQSHLAGLPDDAWAAGLAALEAAAARDPAASGPTETALVTWRASRPRRAKLARRASGATLPRAGGP